MVTQQVTKSLMQTQVAGPGTGPQEPWIPIGMQTWSISNRRAGGERGSLRIGDVQQDKTAIT